MKQNLKTKKKEKKSSTHTVYLQQLSLKHGSLKGRDGSHDCVIFGYDCLEAGSGHVEVLRVSVPAELFGRLWQFNTDMERNRDRI